MRILSKRSILVFFFLFGVFACEKQPDPILQAPAMLQSDMQNSRTVSISEQESINQMIVLAFRVKKRLLERRLSIEENTRLAKKIKYVKDKAELIELLNNFSRSSEDIYREMTQFQQLGQTLKSRGANLNNASSLIANNISKMSRASYFSNLRTDVKPDCAGLCSQQFNIDEETCTNDFSLAIGVGLALGEFSGGLAGSLAFIYAIASYNNCENASFNSHSTCIDNCLI